MKCYTGVPFPKVRGGNFRLTTRYTQGRCLNSTKRGYNFYIIWNFIYLFFQFVLKRIGFYIILKSSGTDYLKTNGEYEMKTKWTLSQANEWYKKLGWMRGCNFNGSDCANRPDMFQKYKSGEKLATADKELALCGEIGFNSVRLWADFETYYQEPESYMEIFDKYIGLCAKHGLKVMVVLTHEEHLSRGDKFVPKKLGEQPMALGYHQNFYPLTDEEKAKKPYHYAEYAETKDKFWEMIRRTVRRYANDERVFCWNVYNEPGNRLTSEQATAILKELFEVVRAEDPVQPLTADIWRGVDDDGNPTTEEERLALELSDVISFHHYVSYEKMVKTISCLKKTGRPVFCTEWLHRIMHNNVFEMYPLFYVTDVGNYCWGFVAGKMQTYEPWELFWEKQQNGEADKYDFTKWQHDLFRPNLRPYDPKEIDLIKRINEFADKK